MPPPRPNPVEDPLFAVRTATGVTASIVLMDVLQVPVPMMLPLLSMAIISNQRGPFNLTRVLTIALLLPVIAYASAFMAQATRDMPVIFAAVFLGTAFAGFYLQLVKGNPLGLFIVMLPGLLSTMALTGDTQLIALRDTFVTIGLMLGVLIPALYLVFPGPPAPTGPPPPPPPPPVLREPLLEAGMRLLVYAPALFAFYTGADFNSIVGLIIVAMVAVHPEHHLRLNEARDRIGATVAGCLAGLALVVVFSADAHLAVELCLVMLTALWFCEKMMTGRFSFVSYQFALSVTLGIAISGVTTRDPLFYGIQRVVVTAGGALYAMGMLVLLEGWLDRRIARRRAASLT